MKDATGTGVLVATPDLRPSLLSILRGLHDGGCLDRVVTTLVFSQAQLDGLGRLPLVGQRLSGLVGRRRLPDFLEGKTHCLWSRELIRTAASRIGRDRLTHKVWKWAEFGFDAAVARRYAGRYAVVYGMEHSSADTFAVQKASGGKTILRQVTAHGRTLAAILRREVVRFPDYATPYYHLLLDEMEEIATRKEREYALADLIVCNSDYVRRTFVENGVEPDRVVAVPTGCPEVDPVGARAGAGAGPLRFLYVGSLSLRKGFPYLLEAWRTLHADAHAELWIAGPCERQVAERLARERGVQYLGTLNKTDLKQVLRQADVMVLPTLCEGLAHSILEALSFGLPVITTVESGVGNLVKPDSNGLIVEAGSAESLATAMAEMMRMRSALPQMGRRSAQLAGRWTVAQSNRLHWAAVADFLSMGRS